MSRRVWLPRLMSYFMVFLMGVAIVSLIGLPWIVNRYVNYVYYLTESTFIKNYFLIVLYLSGGLAILVLIELRKIFNSCVSETPFIMRNVTSLKRIGLAAFFIGGIFITKAVFFLTYLTLIVVFVFALAGLFCFVLADVFEEAVRHKEEIDFTV